MFFQNLKSYAQFYRNDSKTTIYLKYTSVEKFKIFRFHAVMLHWYMIYDELTKNRYFRNAFDFIINVEYSDTTFFRSMKKFKIKYSVVIENEKIDKQLTKFNVDYIYVAVLLHLISDIENRFRNNKSEQNVIHFAFQIRFVNKNLANIESINFEWSILSFLSKKNDLKRYSRTNVIIKSLQYFLSSFKWKHIFVKAKTHFFVDTIISQNFILAWMRQFQNTNSVLEKMNQFVNRSARFFTMILNREKKNQICIETKETCEKIHRISRISFLRYSNCRRSRLSSIFHRKNVTKCFETLTAITNIYDKFFDYKNIRQLQTDSMIINVRHQQFSDDMFMKYNTNSVQYEEYFEA